ncbi:hypothetical protein Goshw_026912 [Gossypium schwendimanii]|uniref:Uncharacterized protein n=1 Tax=Gossypium schwendimanii TaxID=34291 RepID=A0A7J9LIJ3_GOSSC|nr:hypothetical protein [Gossypium schwendimanii]
MDVKLRKFLPLQEQKIVLVVRDVYPLIQQIS